MRILGCLLLTVSLLLGSVIPSFANHDVVVVPRIVHLSWNPNTETDLGGYTVYRGAINCDAQGPLQPLIKLDKGVTEYTDSTLPPTTTLVCYRLTASDIAGNESLQSDQVSKSFLPSLEGMKSPHFMQISRKTATLSTVYWMPGSCSTAYKIYYYISSKNSWSLIGTTLKPEFDITLTSTRRIYRVSGVCADGTEYWLLSGIWAQSSTLNEYKK